MFDDRRHPNTPANPDRPSGPRSSGDRREYSGARLRALFGRLMEKLDELAQEGQQHARSQTELAALLGRLSATIDLEDGEELALARLRRGPPDGSWEVRDVDRNGSER